VRYAWLVIAVLAARFFATAIAFPQLDGDLQWQRWLGRTILERGSIPNALGGETFSAPGSPWTPQEWLFSLAASRAIDGFAWTAFSGAVALCALVALALVARHAELRGASPRAIVVSLVPAGIALFSSFGVRVQVVAWPFLALFILLLDLEGPWAYATIAVAALWSNVHASAVLAPVLAFAAACGTLVDDRCFSAAFKRRMVIAIGSAVATCFNPFGIELPRYAISLFKSPFKEQIAEWVPSNIGNASFLIGALPLLLLACASVAPHTRRSARDLVLLVAFAFLLLGASRNIALFGLIAVPIVAPALTRAFAFFAVPGPPTDARADRIARVALPAFGFVLAIVVGTGLLRSEERTKDDLASHAIASIAAMPGEHRLFCADFAWCGLAVGRNRTSVFLDGRADPYPLAVWNDFDRIIHLQAQWRATLDRYDVNAIVVENDAPLDQALALLPRGGWRRTYGDKRFRVWVRVARSTVDGRRGKARFARA
jgi:hypothetical protein